MVQAEVQEVVEIFSTVYVMAVYLMKTMDMACKEMLEASQRSQFPALVQAVSLYIAHSFCVFTKYAMIDLLNDFLIESILLQVIQRKHRQFDHNRTQQITKLHIKDKLLKIAMSTMQHRHNHHKEHNHTDGMFHNTRQ